MKKNILNTKNELFLIQNSAQLFYFNQLPNSAQLSYFKQWFRNYALNSPIPIQFFTVANNGGISLWEYEKESEEYKSNQMIAYGESGWHCRGGMNEEGIYIAAGHDSKNVKIYDMKYYNYPDHKIELLRSFPHTDNVNECFFKNSTSAMCCDTGGYIKEYNLSNPLSIPTPTIFHETALNTLVSIMETKDKKYIIAGGHQKLYILNANGTLNKTLDYSDNVGSYVNQIAEVRPNILVTVDAYTFSIYNIGDINNITPLKLPDNGWYWSVIALESNPGDFAIGGMADSTNLGVVYINHLEEDNETVNNIKYNNTIQGNNCHIRVIKELKKGAIVFGGNSYCDEMCLWNYAAIPGKDPLCWDDQTNSYIWDFLPVPY